MPFCTQCGTRVDPQAAFCYNCGAPQSAGRTPPNVGFLENISPRTASILCYIPVFGVIPAIVFLASQRFRHHYAVRFNAFQALYLFLAWLIFSSAAPILFLNGIPGSGIEHLLVGAFRMAIIVCWIYLLVKAAQEEQVSLPVLGDLAARSTNEQL